MPEIRTLIQDIYRVVGQEENWLTSDIATQFTSELTLKLQGSFTPQTRSSLRLSGMGPKCPSQLWHSIHTPLAAEPLPPWARIKYTYGHILEALVIAMAKAAGHEVTGEQDAVSVDGVVGHRDCVIDGRLFDIKSASSRAFQKFKDGSIASQDSFGYLDQLDGYLVGSMDDPLVTVKDKGYLLAIDKQMGHLCIYEHEVRPLHIHQRIEDYKRIIDLDVPPRCECGTTPEGKSGNIKLDIKASYNPFKHCCFPKLRTFIYASGPVYLTHVARKPDVTEVNREGKVIYA